MQNQPILYTFIRCPYAIRARIALAYSGIKYEHREVDLKNKPAHLLEISPKGTVPVLLLSNGEVIEESLLIMLWALQQHDPADWFASAQSLSINELIAKNDGPFKENLNRYKYPERFTNVEPGDFHRARCEDFLRELDERLLANSFLTGSTISLADAAIFPFVRQCAMVDLSWFNTRPLPRLQHWLQLWTTSEIFRSIMQKQPK